MSDTNAGSGGRRLAVFAVVDRTDREDESRKSSRWVKIGIAHVNRDGSTNLYLDAFPIGTNKLQVREDDRAVTPAPRRGEIETVEVRP